MNDEPLSRLEADYAQTRMIHIIQRGDEAPRVQWDKSLTENDVIANLVKALLFMTVDDYIIQILEDESESESDEPEQP